MNDNELKDRQDARMFAVVFALVCFFCFTVLFFIAIVTGHADLFLEIVRLGAPAVAGFAGGYGIAMSRRS